MTRKSRQPLKNYGTQPTENKNIYVDKLPEFSRANKYIGEYNVYVRNNEVPDGTQCTIFAFSIKTGAGELRNNISFVRDGIVKFEDLRFVGKSGRGTRFDVYFKFETNPEVVVSYKYAIKVTVDGPRPPRSSKLDGSSSPTNIALTINKRKSDSIDTTDSESDKRMTTISKMIKMDTDSRRSSFSLSKSPESSVSSLSSISSSYPCSPQSSYASSESSSINLQILADTAVSTKQYCPDLHSYYYPNAKSLTEQISQLSFSQQMAPVEASDLNSDAAYKYFCFAVQKYYFLFQQHLIEQQNWLKLNQT